MTPFVVDQAREFGLIEWFATPSLLSVGYLLIFNNPVLDWFDLTMLASVPYNLNIYTNVVQRLRDGDLDASFARKSADLWEYGNVSVT